MPRNLRRQLPDSLIPSFVDRSKSCSSFGFQVQVQAAFCSSTLFTHWPLVPFLPPLLVSVSPSQGLGTVSVLGQPFFGNSSPFCTHRCVFFCNLFTPAPRSFLPLRLSPWPKVASFGNSSPFCALT